MYGHHGKVKHKKHHKRSSSSSSSSSSSDSDDDRKRWKKEQKKLKKLQKKGRLPPGVYPATGGYPGPTRGYPMGSVPPPSMAPYGAGMVPPPAGMAPHGGYPPQQSGYPPAGGYPAQPGYPPSGGPGASPFTAPPAGGYPGYPSQPGYPGQPAQPGYPSQQPFPGQPGQPSYPPQQPYPGQQYPGQQYPGSNVGFGGNGAPQGPPGSGPFQAPPPASQSAMYPAQPGGPQYPPQQASSQPYGQPPMSGPYPGSAPAPGGYPGQVPPAQAPPAGQYAGHAPPGGQYPGQAAPPGGQYPGQAAPPSGQYPGGAVPPAGQHPPGAAYAGGIPPTGQAPPSQAGLAQAMQDFEKMKIYGTAEKFEGTIRPVQPFNAEADATVLRNAMKGAGTDEAAIINLISCRSNAQRQQIKLMFKTMYGKDLIKDLESELSGDFRETIMALFVATTYYDAWTLRNAMEGLGTKDSVLIEILCTRTNAEIQEIKQCYTDHFRRNLEKDIVNDTSGHFKRLLVSCCQANRAELTPEMWQRVFQQGIESVVDRAQAQKDAQELYQAGEKKWGTDESTFLKIMALRHFYQLRATFEEYSKVAQRDILKSIDREMSGDVCEGFKAVVWSARDRPQYFADKLYRAMKGAGTDESTLIRIVVSRSEVDMVNIKRAFMQKYQKTLSKFIEGDTSGDFKRILIGIVGRD